MSYFMFPTEALLLGECLGEHESGRGYFLDIVRSRVLPMMPSLIKHKLDPELGPVTDDSRKSLLDLILSQLGDAVARSHMDRALGLLPAATQLAHYWQSIVEIDPTSDNARGLEAALRRPSRDDSTAIAALLEAAASECGRDRLLSLGRSFGRAVANAEAALEPLCLPQIVGALVDHENNEFRISDYLPKGTLSDLAGELQAVAPGVAFEHLKHADAEVEFEYDLESSGERPVLHVNRVLGAIWLAFGEALGAVRDSDVFARMEDSESPTPRAFRMTTDSSPDAIRQALKDCELSLTDAATGAASPERVVRELSFVVEAVAKQVWPDLGTARTFGKTLTEKIRTTSGLEKRFAGTAMSLYFGYRNAAAHEHGTFSCSYAEARYFAAGVRALLDIADRLANEPNQRST